MNVLLLSTYELGRQPFGLASPAAWLRRAGVEVSCMDLSRERLDADLVSTAALVGIYLPMHTATRLAMPVIDRVRAINPAAHLCCFGLYAPLNDAALRARGVDTILGPEFEEELVSVACRPRLKPGPTGIPRLDFIAPDRRGLPALDRYAAVQYGADRIVAGYTEASRGCKHLCRHCPIVPIYQGQFRVVPVEIVMADVRSQVQQGARHITFGDPDFFNGVTHARRIVDAFHREFPALTYDVTIKVEHLLKHCDALPSLRETGCLFVTSAVESIDDRVLVHLEKGHTRAGFVEAVARCREAGLVLAPTFVTFTPWTTIEGYVDLLDTIEGLDLVEHVAPIQLAIRLLVTSGSRLLELPDILRVIGPFDPQALTYPWTHPDPRVDELQQQVMRLVGTNEAKASYHDCRSEVFEAISAVARTFVTNHRPSLRSENLRPNLRDEPPRRARATIPYLTEPWYC